jgi:N-acetylneuraminic acid mutarotase
MSSCFSPRGLKGLGFAVLLTVSWMGSMGCDVDEAVHDPAPPLESVSQAMLSSPSWTAAASMGTVRSRATAVRLNSGKVLVAGGASVSSSTILSSAELYDPTTNTWSSAGNMAVARREHAAALLLNGKVLVVGGGNSSNHAAAELYDPTTNTWSSAGSMTVARSNPTATVLNNGQVLVTGNNFVAELYDPATNSWSSTGWMTAIRQLHTATLLPDGRVLVTGGWNGPTYASAELYNRATNTWTAAASMTTPRQSHTATLLPNGKVLVAGGWNDVAGAELYDPALNTWSPAGAMSTARGFHIAALVNGKVLVSGGHTSSAPMTQTAELYNPATNSWTATASMTLARSLHMAAALLNGKVLVMGGYFYSSTELYSPTDFNLGSVLGNNVAQNSSCGATNVVTPICSSSAAPEVSYTWTAPYEGAFTFTTAGSSFDTILQIVDDSTGTIMGCNDDASATVQSSLTAPLLAGQRITIIVDGYSAHCGNYVLNILPPPCMWTQWYDRDNPSGVGDYELRVDQTPAVCAAPLAVECKTLSDMDWTQTGETLLCTPSDGFSCANSSQSDGACQDYKVRFCCP